MSSHMSLLSLPAEIRNAIYMHVFASPFAVEFDKMPIQHPLTRSCRQIRNESLGMYYTMTRFNAHIRDGPIEPLLSWMRTIGRANCLLVREIRLWDMHDNVLTMMSPTAAEILSQDVGDGVSRHLSIELSPPDDNDAMIPKQRAKLWKTVTELKLGMRQVKERYLGSSLTLSISCYVLTDLS